MTGCMCFFLPHPKAAKVALILTCSIFSYITLTCLLNNKYYLFCYEKQSTMLCHNIMLSTTTKLMQQKLFTWKQLCVFILCSNKKLLIYYFHQETNSIVHLVKIVMNDIFLTSFAVYVKKA